MTRHYTCRWCWWGCHAWWHDALNMLPWVQRRRGPLTHTERIAYEAGFRAATVKLDAEMRAQRIALRDQIEADLLGISVVFSDNVTPAQQAAWHRVYGQCGECQCCLAGGCPECRKGVHHGQDGHA